MSKTNEKSKKTDKASFQHPKKHAFYSIREGKLENQIYDRTIYNK